MVGLGRVAGVQMGDDVIVACPFLGDTCQGGASICVNHTSGESAQNGGSLTVTRQTSGLVPAVAVAAPALAATVELTA